MNIVTNFVEFADKEIAQEILTKFQDKSKVFGSIDFEKIVPIPKTLNVPEDDRIMSALNVYFSSINPETENMGIEKIDEENYNKLLSKVQSRRGTIPILDNLSFDTVTRISQDFFDNTTKYKDNWDDVFQLGETMVNNLLEYDVFSEKAFMSRYWGITSQPFDEKEQDKYSRNAVFKTNIFPPVDIYKQLSLLYPEKELIVYLQREDDDFYCGEMIFLNGEKILYQEHQYGTDEEKIISRKCKEML